MLLKDKESQIEEHVISAFPKVLALTAGGEPMRWITYEDLAFYAAKDKILWTMGKHEIVLRGGTNVETGKQSILSIDTIVALKTGKKTPIVYREPALYNRILFRRDQCVCAYCGGAFNTSLLTRDHVKPTSKGGPDVWENVVTSCYSCNQKKGNRTPEEANMPLLYVPYVPSYYESLILQNKNILADQMEFLISGVSEHSRLKSAA